MTNLTRLAMLLAAVLIFAAACATTGPGELTELTSSPQTVDAREDNAPVLTRTVPGLIITLNMKGSEVDSFDAQVVAVSGSSSANDQSGVVTVQGLRGGTSVASMSVASQQLNVQEAVGLVTVEVRTLVGMMALPERIDTLVVEAPGMLRARKLDVRPVFEAFCKQYNKQDGKQKICEAKR